MNHDDVRDAADDDEASAKAVGQRQNICGGRIGEVDDFNQQHHRRGITDQIALSSKLRAPRNQQLYIADALSIRVFWFVSWITSPGLS